MKKLPMELVIQKFGGVYYWVVFDHRKVAVAKSTRGYSKKCDAKRAFEKLDRMF